MLRDAFSTPPARHDIGNAAEAAPASAPDEDLTSVAVNTPEVAELSPAERQIMLDADRILEERICRQLDAGLDALHLKRPQAYGNDVRALLRQAWASAAYMRSRAVVAMHLFAALASEPRTAETLSEIAGVDAQWLVTGSIVRTSLLRVSFAGRPDREIAQPSPQVLKWLAEAGDCARRARPDKPELTPGDLVDVLRDRNADAGVKGWMRQLLKEAADLGRTPAEYVQTRQDVDSTHRTVRQFRAETTQRFARIRTGVGAIDRNLESIASRIQLLPDRRTMMERFDRLEARLEQAVGTPRAAGDQSDIGTALGAIDARLASLEQRGIDQSQVDVGPVATAVEAAGRSIRSEVYEAAVWQEDKLARIERRADAIEAKLPAPPSWAFLATSVIGVMALGAGLGLMLAR